MRRPARLRATLGLLAAALLAACPAPALAWSKPSHQTTGAIAWADLAARDPQALAELLALARAHPDYPLFEAAARHLPGPQRQRALFEWLARWPDDIRAGAVEGGRKGRYDMPDWHFELQVVPASSWRWPLRNGNASLGYALNYARLADPCVPAALRAQALGWLIHIVGDIQQPLHAGHRMDGQFPLTDRAGILGFVRRTPGATPTPLHEYWDQMMEDSGVRLPAGQQDWAGALIAQWPRRRLPELAVT